MPFELDGLIHAYNDTRDEFITKEQCKQELNQRQWDRLFKDGWVIVNGVTYEL